jgi:hypothetical protein
MIIGLRPRGSKDGRNVRFSNISTWVLISRWLFPCSPDPPVSQTEGITARRFDGGAGEEAGEVKEIEAVADVLCISLKPRSESTNPRRPRHRATDWV